MRKQQIMKKNLFLLAVAAGVFTLVSCTKDYNCVCEYQEGVIGIYNTVSQTNYTINGKADDASDKCDTYELPVVYDDEFGYTSHRTVCTIK